MTVDHVSAGIRNAIEVATSGLVSEDSRLPESELEAVMLKALVEQGNPDRRPRSQASISLKGWSGRLGPVDLALEEANGPMSAAIELKSMGSDELAACAWDVVKLGQGIAEGAFHRGFLLAAAPLAAWEKRVSGTELFEDRDFELNGHLRRYEKWFEFWRRDVQNYPRRLQSRRHASPLASTSFARGDVPWQLRLAEITLDGATQKMVIYAPKALGEEGDDVDPAVEEQLRHSQAD